MFPFTQKHKFIPSFLRAIIWRTFSPTSPNLTTCMMLNIGISPRTAEFFSCARCVGCSPPYHEICANPPRMEQSWLSIALHRLGIMEPTPGPANQRFLLEPFWMEKVETSIGWNMELWGGHGTTYICQKHFISCIYLTTKNYWWFTFRKVVVVGGLLPKRTNYSAICWPHISQLELFVKNMIRLAWNGFTKTEWLKRRSLHKKDVDFFEKIRDLAGDKSDVGYGPEIVLMQIEFKFLDCTGSS